MATIDEQVAAYMRNWLEGVQDAQVRCESPNWPGRDAGRLAYLAAELAERERLSYCDCCEVKQGIGIVCRTPKPDCKTCGGTGRKAT